MNNKLIIRGREITEEDISLIREVIGKNFSRSRRYISRRICEQWQWYQPSGHLKDRACRDILLYLHRQELIKLPCPQIRSNNRGAGIKGIELPEKPISGTESKPREIELKLLKTKEEKRYWDGIVARYHYQGHKLIVGKFLKYMAYRGREPVGCIGWGSAAWSIRGRDEWIGWDKKIKDKNLDKIVNNIRFLILPWVKIKNLASYLLSKNVRRIKEDWERQYGTGVYLLETFVERERFAGTCYEASNWRYLGETRGSAKRGSFHDYHGNIKKIYVYPLSKDFRERLKAEG